MRLFSHLVKLLSVACFVFVASVPSWADQMYSRKEVEAHLRMLYPSWGEKSFMQEKLFKEASFDDFLGKEAIGIAFGKANSQEELDVTDQIFKHIVHDIVGKPVHRIKKGEKFDIVFLVSDELDDVLQTPLYRSVLKGNKTTEEEYSKHYGSQLIMQHVTMESGRSVMVLAVERSELARNDIQAYASLIKQGMFWVLASISGGPVITPSFADPRAKLENLPPIDLALLRAIYQHKDWPSMDYETRIQNLTDRVLVQLAQIDN